MTLQEAMTQRHSVRQYQNAGLEADLAFNLRQFIDECNRMSGLHMQLVQNDPDTFTGLLAKYGKFENVNHYVAIVGKSTPDMAEACGYYGEKVVLCAQQMGLNTCWVGMSYKKSKCKAVVREDEKLYIVLALGHGVTQGVAHNMRDASHFDSTRGQTPDWYKSGLDAVRYAPSAMNRARFRFQLRGDTVAAHAGRGTYAKIDLGIAKYHFEVGAGRTVAWAENA